MKRGVRRRPESTLRRPPPSGLTGPCSLFSHSRSAMALSPSRTSRGVAIGSQTQWAGSAQANQKSRNKRQIIRGRRQVAAENLPPLHAPPARHRIPFFSKRIRTKWRPSREAPVRTAGGRLGGISFQWCEASYDVACLGLHPRPRADEESKNSRLDPDRRPLLGSAFSCASTDRCQANTARSTLPSCRPAG